MASSQQNLLPPPTAIDDTHKVYSIAIACIVLGVVTSLIVLSRLGLRIYARAFGADDWAMIPGLVSHRCFDKIVPSLIFDQAVLHRLDCNGCVCESPCRCRQAALGDHCRGVFSLVQGMFKIRERAKIFKSSIPKGQEA